MATKRRGDSCYDKAGMDEPIFVLRAKDKLAPAVVRRWADIAAMYEVNPAKVHEAECLANEMELWADKHGSKVPD